jgi:hypothetical protein
LLYIPESFTTLRDINGFSLEITGYIPYDDWMKKND